MLLFVTPGALCHGVPGNSMAEKVGATVLKQKLAREAMAAPMAVSSWNTAGEAPSRGSTVLELRMRGRGNTPPAASIAAFSAGRFSHRLLVLKNL